jgi:RNA polymerase sigma-70 factor (ECF subfamily)
MSGNGLLKIFLDTRPALHHYLLLRGAKSDEAEDILQDISIKLSTEAFGVIANPRAYLYKMASNYFLLRRRTEQRRVRREEDWVDTHGGESRNVDQRPSAETDLIAREQLAILQRVVDRLPERTRTIFRRFRIDGEPQRRIAEDLGISVSAVEKHLTRAYEEIATIRRRLDEDCTPSRYLKHERGRHEH